VHIDWMVTSRASPSLRMQFGHRLSLTPVRLARRAAGSPPSCPGDAAPGRRRRQVGLGDDVQFDAKMHHGLRDLRPDAADDAVRPISRAAATVFSRCWATRVSTVGTPVMSMMAISAS